MLNGMNELKFGIYSFLEGKEAQSGVFVCIIQREGVRYCSGEYHRA